MAKTGSAADELAHDGQETSLEPSDVMSTVAHASADVADDVEALRERIDAIDEVVEVIQDIAQQPNMLAPNASIEAARAGEEGEGFPGFADEPKGLAEESQGRLARSKTSWQV